MPKKVDANHAEIVQALRLIPHVSVRSTHTIGQGFPDIAVGYSGLNFLFEIKADEKKKLTPQEKDFLDTWRGQVTRVNSFLEVVNEIRHRLIQLNGESAGAAFVRRVQIIHGDII